MAFIQQENPIEEINEKEQKNYMEFFLHSEILLPLKLTI